MGVFLKESPEEKRRRLIELAKASVTTAYSTGEHSVILAINTYNEIERTRNLIHEKLEDWYGIFFPELRLNNPLTYARFVIDFGMDKKGADKAEIALLLETGADEVTAKIERSIGKEPSGAEYTMLKGVAESELALAKEEEALDAYMKERVKELMPNISHLIDYKVAAELLAKAGSLTKLALMPASTVQLLGAEKSLFKHIRFHTKPPKYGVLFKLPQISAASKRNRGRIARLYAAKICIAAKADAFTKNFIAEKLKEQIDKTMEKYAKEPERPERPQQRREGQWQQRGGQGRQNNWRGQNRRWQGNRGR
jgi:nucleolar protein 56